MLRRVTVTVVGLLGSFNVNSTLTLCVSSAQILYRGGIAYFLSTITTATNGLHSAHTHDVAKTDTINLNRRKCYYTI